MNQMPSWVQEKNQNLFGINTVYEIANSISVASLSYVIPAYSCFFGLSGKVINPIDKLTGRRDVGLFANEDRRAHWVAKPTNEPLQNGHSAPRLVPPVESN